MSKKHKQHHEEHIDETWLIPYADLMTLLLALFIILFASSQVDSKKYEQIMQGLNSAFNGGVSVMEPSSVIPINDNPMDQTKKEDYKQPSQDNATVLTEQQKEQLEKYEKEMQDMKALQEKVDGYIQENGLTTQLETKLTEDLLMITIRDNALFSSGSANVKPDAQKLAVAISNMLSQYPQYQVEVAGHTDTVPIRSREFESNWDLSSKRALNFMKYLLQNDQVGPARFKSIGYGEYRPIDTNDTEDGRSKNRRVEVSILRTVKQPELKSVTQ
ncbi:flagellar motor protein MotB [Paenibacillus sp. y28]|uniref:flagellar motor protein MotB n=1 Tax=Paenibacillus sp. y28 TaxID=3129110 RepID=UPI003018A4C0